MAPKSQEHPKCQICETNTSKYTCAQCRIVYCSVACYKNHKASSCGTEDSVSKPSTSTSAEILEAGPSQPLANAPENVERDVMDVDEEPLKDPKPLRPLTSLNWPYIPEESAFPDPLKRDDPKVLQLRQYESIATSPTVRKVLRKHPNLPALLTSIDKLRGRDREDALQKALGVTASDVVAGRSLEPMEITEDTLALRELAEAIEGAVRGENPSALGLNWESAFS